MLKGYRTRRQQKAETNSQKTIGDICEKVITAKGSTVKLSKKEYNGLKSELKKKYESTLEGYGAKFKEKDVEIRRSDLENALHYLKKPDYHPSVQEAILRRNINYGGPQSKRVVQNIAHKVEETETECIKLSRKELKNVAKLSTDKQEKKLENYLSKGQSKYVEIPRDQLIYSLEHLREERGEKMSQLERLAYRSAAALLIIASIGLIGIPSVTGYSTASSTVDFLFRIPISLMCLFFSGFMFVKSNK